MHSTNNLADGYLGSGTQLHRSVKKYGKHNHRFEILEKFENRVLLREREREIVNEALLNDSMCMNLALGAGSNGTPEQDFGQKISAALTGRKNLAHSLRMTGRKLTDEHKQKIGKKHKGRIRWDLRGKPGHRKGKKHTLEAKEKISKAGLGRSPPQKGTKLSAETKQKISNSVIEAMKDTSVKEKCAHWKGKKLSDEHCRNISLANAGKKFSEEARANMSRAAKNRKKRPPCSLETREKMSLSIKEAWAKKRLSKNEHKA